ncbi:MAG: putative quinol monooxygenase [Alphaproteobacteria bacterium]
MLLIIGTIRLPAAMLGQAKVAMESMISASRAEAGCTEYSYSEDVLEAGLVHVKEMWQTREALDQHFASAHIATWRATWKTLGITDRNLVLYEVGEGQPI